jgi:hypothetical protein
VIGDAIMAGRKKREAEAIAMKLVKRMLMVD